MLAVSISFRAIGAAVLLGAALLPGAARAEGALAVGITDDVARHGVAYGYAINFSSVDEARRQALRHCENYKDAPQAAKSCRLISTFRDQCWAIAMDPKTGTPGVGWAIAPSKREAEQRAVDDCKFTAGSDRREFCKIDDSKCDDK